MTSQRKKLQWKPLQLKIDGTRFNYGRFVLSQLMKGQADTIGIAMRRTLLTEVEGTRITRVIFENVLHEYSTIFGIEESIHEILTNLGEIVLRGNPRGICDAFICVMGPGCVTAQSISLPPSASVEIVDTAQHIATLTEPIQFRIRLQIERRRGYPTITPENYNMITSKNYKDGIYYIDPAFMSVRNVNYSVQPHGNGSQEILFLEICTDGSLTPSEALSEALSNLVDFFSISIDGEKEREEKRDRNFDPEDNQSGSEDQFIFATRHYIIYSDKIRDFIKKTKRATLENIDIDQLGLTRKMFYRLKLYNIHTLWDLVDLTPQDFMRLKIHLFPDDMKRVFTFLQEHSLLE